MSLKSISRTITGLLGLPLTAEAFVQNLLLLGFFVLLLLVAAIGYWSRESIREVDQEITSLYQQEYRNLLIVQRIGRTAAIMWNQASNLLAYDEANLLHGSAKRQLARLKREMDDLIDQAGKTRIASTPEWERFVSTYGDYWAELNAPIPGDWSEERDQMAVAIRALEDCAEREREQSEALARSVNVSERNKVLVTTLAAIVVGLFVGGLTFYEIRRMISRLGGAYRASAEARDYLQSLFDGLISGVVVIDLDGTVQTVSHSFAKVIGQNQDKLLHQDYRELFKGKSQLLEGISKYLTSDLPEGRYIGRTELGRDRLFEVFASPLMISDEYRGLILVLMDITETERAQSELRRNRALAAVGQMTAQIAHEIKNPLGSIRFAAELIKRESKAADQSRETVEVIDRSVDHLSRIVAELSEFARPKQLNLCRTNINELLDGLAPMIADRLERKNLELVKKFSPSLPAGDYDQTELRKLFLNLIINAIDASEPGNEIELRTGVDGNHGLIVEVVDHGEGMDAETLSRLFEPFYTTKQGGTGLGMAISKKIAELHRGDLHVVSRQGEGTRVTLRLPMD
ncbi:MAG TPA: ATP-binding protein [Blastocatellia bacterium]|nr:ATP-binding protein [Blastocatellia bacterium]